MPRNSFVAAAVGEKKKSVLLRATVNATKTLRGKLFQSVLHYATFRTIFLSENSCETN